MLSFCTKTVVYKALTPEQWWTESIKTKRCFKVMAIFLQMAWFPRNIVYFIQITYLMKIPNKNEGESILFYDTKGKSMK